MTRIHIIDPDKCTRCRYFLQLGDSTVLVWRCLYPVTVSMFDCQNRQVVGV